MGDYALAPRFSESRLQDDRLHGYDADAKDCSMSAQPLAEIGGRE